MSKSSYKAKGKDYSPQKGFFNSDIDVKMPAQPDPPAKPDKNWVAGAGEPITTAAFTEMQAKYNAWKSESDTEFVTFSREAILSVLSQFGCAGIKFYFVERPNNTKKQLTLVMVGVDTKNESLIGNTGGELKLMDGEQDPYYSNMGNGWPPQ